MYRGKIYPLLLKDVNYIQKKYLPVNFQNWRID